jgi:hypothetical protein
VIALKFLRSGAQCLFQARTWPLPAADQPGPWLEAAPGPLVPCRNGLHACRANDLAFWLADELWQVELAGEWISAPDALVARRARLVRRIERWETHAARAEFGEQCVARARAATSQSQPVAGAAQYLEQAEDFAKAGHHPVAAYAAALVFGALVPATDAMSAFRSERREQGELLASVLALR